MNKNIVIENAKKKFDGDLLEIVIKQIEDFFELQESSYVVENKYQINDDVKLNENHLLHGIGKYINLLEEFA